MDIEYKSRTQKKKEDKILQRLAEDLVALQPGLLKTIDMPDALLEAIEFARSIKSHGARRRQIKHIGAIMRQIDVQPIKTAFDHIRPKNG